MHPFRGPLIAIAFLSIMTMIASGQSKVATQIDEFGSVSCEDYLARMDNAIIQAANNPTAKIFVLIYEGKIRRSVYSRNGTFEIRDSNPEFRTAKAKIASMKKLIARRARFPDARPVDFEFVAAGLQEYFKVELWLVSAGADPPPLRPTLKKIKYRRGKPFGFCLSCGC